MIKAPPQTEAELLASATALLGQTIGALSEALEVIVPDRLDRHKGWLGQLIERHLGASAGNLSLPDFPELGIELKTIPVDAKQSPKESTFVCSIDLCEIGKERWETSTVRQKTNHVLWIPVEADPAIPLAARRVGKPVLWRPSAQSHKILAEDWEELVDSIVMGELETLTAKQGQYLQIRPKAANAKALCRAVGAGGQPIWTLPRGFYLRTCLTRAILSGESWV